MSDLTTGLASRASVQWVCFEWLMVIPVALHQSSGSLKGAVQ